MSRSSKGNAARRGTSNATQPPTNVAIAAAKGRSADADKGGRHREGHHEQHLASGPGCSSLAQLKPTITPSVAARLPS